MAHRRGRWPGPIRGRWILLGVCAGVLALSPSPAEQLSDDAIAELEEEVLFAEGDGRDELVKKLVALKDRRTQGTLAKLLLAETPLKVELQDAVFSVLAQVADQEIQEEVEEMAASPGPTVRHYGLRLLGRMQNERAADLLIAASRSSSNTDQMRSSIARSLGENGHPKAVPGLRDLAAKCPELVDEVTIARFRVGDVDAFGAFFDLYQAKAEVLAETAWEYGFRTGTPAEVKRLKKSKQELEAVLGRMEDALRTTRPESIPALIKHANAKEDPKVYNLLFCSLPGLVRADNAELFLPLLDCPSSEVASMALRRMEAVGGPELKGRIRSRLLELLKDGDVYLRRLALENADLFGEEKGLEVLQVGLKDDSLWVREKALEEIRKWEIRKGKE